MNYFSKEKGAISLIVLILLAVVIMLLIIFGIYVLKSSESSVTENPVASGSNTSTQEVAIPDIEDVPEADDSIKSNFTYSFLKLENEDVKNENIIYSPLSIKYALKLLVEGADGNTKAEIEKIIENEGLTKYENIDKKLSLANAVFIRDTYKDRVLDSYVDTVKDKYNSEIKYDSFKNAKNVNKWVEDKTFDIIKDFLEDNQVQNPNLEMILINALAIDMEWKSKFSTENTYSGIFDEDGENLNAAFMHNSEVKTKGISYKLDKDVTVLAMDLEENDGVTLEFDAIMPNKVSLDEFISSSSKESIDNYLSNLKESSDAKDGVNITIPKFDFDYSISLKKELIELGMKEAFSLDADFSKITEDKSLYVGDALHKADIEFSEDGVRAAAVTAFMMLEKAMIMEKTHPVEVIIDKPFMFVIRDKETSEVWFTGSVYKPVLWDDVKEEYGR